MSSQGSHLKKHAKVLKPHGLSFCFFSMILVISEEWQWNHRERASSVPQCRDSLRRYCWPGRWVTAEMERRERGEEKPNSRYLPPDRREEASPVIQSVRVGGESRICDGCVQASVRYRVHSILLLLVVVILMMLVFYYCCYC